MAEVRFDRKKMKLPIEMAEKRLIAMGIQLENDIKRSMIAGTGRVYGGHVASAPGHPPAVDTGRLRASISTNWSNSSFSRGKVGGQAQADDGIGKPDRKENLFTVVVGTNVESADFLERGTRKMLPRPYIRPAFDRLKSRLGRSAK